MLQRADALLSRYGYCSRKEARQWLSEGRLRIPSGRITDPAVKINPADVTVDGAPVEYPEGLFVKVHKPVGYVCSHDPAEGPSVYDLLPPQWMRRNPHPTVIGRLDKDTTGLVLITDDHQLVHRLISPKNKIPKVYRVGLDRLPDAALIEIFAAGTLLLKGEKTPCLPAAITEVSDTVCRVTLHEGRYHQVKRMFAACGFQVTALHRLSIGAWQLGKLEEGRWEVVAFPEK
ncbi:MAG: rRNA pseudouridine synthase [Chitinispirillaceae bacterium]|nr:rRNA pseudouridine synthase [Chitinispirillaceae bacterium]